ncbi:flavin reductase [Streptomyces albiflaviniger]|nr:flavin reductase [Streptomyces albiflaviniger]
MTPELFKHIMRHQAATVVLITTDGGDRVGLTATSLTSVSADPPLVLFCVARTASAWPALSVTDRIVIHLLGEDSQELARRFSTTGIDRFDHPAIGHDEGLTSVAAPRPPMDGPRTHNGSRRHRPRPANTTHPMGHSRLPRTTQTGALQTPAPPSWRRSPSLRSCCLFDLERWRSNEGSRSGDPAVARA